MFPADFEGGHATPRIVSELGAGRAAHAVWCNEIGGVVFQLGEGEGETREFLKWTPHGNGVDLSREIKRLRWAVEYIVVPRVIKQGADDEGSWFVTAGLAGTSAVDERWRREPAKAVRAIGVGLRALHDTLPVAECPFEWSAEDRVARTKEHAAAGTLDPSKWDESHRHLTVERGLDLLADIPPVDKLVVCHGDACSPNTLLDDNGDWCAHVDLDTLGVADRWADLAVATLATEWNYGPGWTEPLLAAYGIEPDWERIAYYRLLWDLCY
ncbi:aminoglycoside 3'-phosphotransferase [Actinospica sp.]|uniref:aminoglycoside 3'-phosphotransferase n=1 Tax=Actinospica sp. TaxID=1872142 RepID=UPI002C074A29|nr:aminoglycoside 3'-phosphotransferase [Actinospica sp.]HWG23009.1 aminoglycoside 3'-phosphotransferase [Actinospica sp.]